MTVATEEFVIDTAGFSDFHDITGFVAKIVTNSGLNEGVVTVFTPGSTAGITSVEYEPGAVADLKDAIERMAPQTIAYAHDARWGDGNGFSRCQGGAFGRFICCSVFWGENYCSERGNR